MLVSKDVLESVSASDFSSLSQGTRSAVGTIWFVPETLTMYISPTGWPYRQMSTLIVGAGVPVAKGRPEVQAGMLLVPSTFVSVRNAAQQRDIAEHSKLVILNAFQQRLQREHCG